MQRAQEREIGRKPSNSYQHSWGTLESAQRFPIHYHGQPSHQLRRLVGLVCSWCQSLICG